MEPRLDRIEKGIEKLFEGIAALTESQQKTDGQIIELKESQMRTDEQLNRTDEQLSRTIKKLDDIGRQLGDLGLVQGEVAEDLFYRNVRYLFKEERDLC
jgi:septal ring factor EnvC (AmiA/AmiB activator)